jgi:hypothetical protein
LTEGADDELLERIHRSLHPFRRIGHDLRAVRAEYVALDVALEVCAQPNHLNAHVRAALLDAFSNRVLAGGALGYFHPDNLTFGRGIFVSALVAAGQAVPGVACVKVIRLQRRLQSANHELENGVLPIGAWEVAQLDNDPNHPERGRLDIVVSGGR